LRYEQKGSGAIIFVGEVAVKASSVDRAFGMGKLCKRLGEFVPGNYASVVPKLEPEPVSSVHLEAWKEYRSECVEARRAPPVSVGKETLARLKARHQEEWTKLPSRLNKHPRSILNIGRHCLKLRQREELRRLRRETIKARRAKRDSSGRLFWKRLPDALHSINWGRRNATGGAMLNAQRHTPSAWLAILNWRGLRLIWRKSGKMKKRPDSGKKNSGKKRNGKRRGCGCDKPH
jgi:hypothetical protein